MKILVTGSAGQLGSDLVPLLEKEGNIVTGLSSALLDITDRDGVLRQVDEAKPGVIINCGAYTKVDLAEKKRERAFAVNRDGAGNLAEAARNSGAALIHISTDFVFDGNKSTPYVETEEANPLSVYGESKYEGEKKIIDKLPRHIIIRTSWLYGASGNNFVKTILKYASERDKLRIVYDQTGTPTWTYDLADAIVNIIRALDAGRKDYGIYHYSNEGVASWYDFADLIIEEAGRAGADLKCKIIEPILTSEYPTPAKRPAYSVLDKGKIKKTFGVSIPCWRRSLRKMLDELYGGKDA